jgi:hypothetical protein
MFTTSINIRDLIESVKFMSLIKSWSIPKLTLKKAFLLIFLMIFSLILAGVLHSSTPVSAVVPEADSSMSQGSEVQELLAQSPAPTTIDPAPIAPPETPASDTALLFQNDRYAVRVFRERDQAYVNVYDKASQTQPLDKVPVSITPAGNPDKDPTQYIATIGDQQYTVTINPQGASELTIVKGGDGSLSADE